MRLKHYSLEFKHPAVAAPEWGQRVERWYQLDAPAFGLAELYWQNRNDLPKPDRIFLASPGASNATDRNFALAPSPSKFVHTLPSVRGSALLQLMGWYGEVFCLQRDPITLLTALNEAVWAYRERPIWLASVTGSKAHIFVLSADGPFTLRKTPSAKACLHDKDWLSWMESPSSLFEGPGFQVRQIE